MKLTCQAAEEKEEARGPPQLRKTGPTTYCRIHYIAMFFARDSVSRNSYAAHAY